ncbi:MAG: YfiR family protein [Deltaproteobacteria bacterium]|nr:YfiR family protein [Deltaproteobacteria bacterium]
MNRRGFLAGASALLLSRLARGAASVPPNLQAQLVVKVAAFDRNFAARAGATALVLAVQRGGDNDSTRLASAVVKSLGDLGDIAGRPKQVEILTFASATALADRIKKNKVAIAYLSTGLDDELPQVASALVGVDVLTYGATGGYASKGTVVGFDLEESKPKLVVNVARAKAQNVSFKAELLKLARIVG